MWIAFVKLLKVFAWPDVRKMRRWWFSHTASRGSEIINNSRKFAPSFAGNPATQISHFSCFTNTHNTVTAIIETMTLTLMILLGCSMVEGWLQWLCQNELFLVLVWPITVHVKWSIFEEFSRSIGADGKWRATIFEENPVQLFPPSASSELAKSFCSLVPRQGCRGLYLSFHSKLPTASLMFNSQHHPFCLFLQTKFSTHSKVLFLIAMRIVKT